MKDVKIDATAVSFGGFLTTTKKFARSKKSISATKFELPEFQRGFVWGREEICRLINDIKEQKELYLGNVVTASVEGGVDYLIDGQQRLVTLLILCLVLKNNTNDQSLKNKIDQLIYRNAGEPRIKFSKNNLNRFYKKLLNGDNLDSADESEKFIKNAFYVIKKETSSLFDSQISDLFNNIKNINIVVIKCLDVKQLSRLFVGLNSTGIELSQVSLVKGYLHEKTSKHLWRYWIFLEKSFEKNKIFWFDQFLRHQWYLVGGYITSSKLSTTINKEKIKKSNSELSKYLKDLKEDSIIYLALRKNELSSLTFPRSTRNNSARQIYLVLENIHTFGLQQVYPVILALYKYGKKENKYHIEGHSLKDFNKLWSFLFLAKYSKINPSSYEKVFAKFCFDISRESLEYDFFKKITKKFFTDLRSRVEFYEKKFIKELDENYRDNEDRITKIMLYQIYDPEEKLAFNGVGVEHILPQGRNGEGSFVKWKCIPSTDYNLMRSYIYRLGNLSILEENKNNKIGDCNFEKKKKIYNTSYYSDNKKISYYDFSSTKKICKSIEKRGKLLAKKIFVLHMKKLKE